MVVAGVSHSCLLVELGPNCNSMAASLCLKSCEDHSLIKSYNGGLMEKQLQVLVLKKNIKPVLLDTLAVTVCDLYYVLMHCFDFSKSYNDFSFQKVHLLKTKIIKTAEKEPYSYVGDGGWLCFPSLII